MVNVFQIQKVGISGSTYRDTGGHWCEIYLNKFSDIAKAIEPGVDFRPDNTLTRGEMAAILNKVFHYPLAVKNSYRDLPDDYIYHDAILKAIYYGVFPMTDSKIRPYDPITRQEAVTAAYCAAGICDRSEGVASGFRDFNLIAPWAQTSVVSLEGSGLLDSAGGYFQPDKALTRAEGIALIGNAINYYKGFDLRNLVADKSAAGMKVYFLITGTLRMPTGSMYADGSFNTWIRCPVYSVLIDHRDGLILYDAGINLKEIGADKFMQENYTPSEKGTLLEQMAALGHKAEDVDYVIVSHLHSDHCANIHAFPNAKVYCNRRELTLSYLKYATGGHNLLAECEVHAQAAARKELNYELVGDETRIELVPGVTIFNYNVQGHAYGMLYLLIQMPDYGNVFVVADGVYDSIMYGGKEFVSRKPNISLHFQLDKDGWYGQHAMVELISVLNDCREIWFGHSAEYLENTWRSGADYYS